MSTRITLNGFLKSLMPEQAEVDRGDGLISLTRFKNSCA
jgi:hypothetical protein